MPRLDLPDVTLCCVDTRSVPQALQALQRCMAAARFGEVIFFGPQGQAQAPGIRQIAIPALSGIQDYNHFMLRGLLPHVRTSHVLIVQWDGFITHPDRWRPEFLDWDYIGAPWYWRGQPGMVGNGGFSLRSRRLLEALARLDVDTSRPEDAEICQHLRPQLEQSHGIRMAPLGVAEAFSCEYGTYRPAFGFHGMHNFAHVMPEAELSRWLDTAPPELITTRHARNLVKALMHRHRGREAVQLLHRRASVMGWTLDQCALYMRAQVLRLRGVTR